MHPTEKSSGAVRRLDSCVMPRYVLGMFWPSARRVCLVLSAIGVLGCGDASPTPPRATGQLRIAAASDLKFTLDEIIAAFQKSHPGSTITPTYGSSGSFFAQLTNEGPFDLFLSADIAYPRKLIEQGQALRESEFLYATGRIVVWVPTASKLDLEQRGIEAVADPSVRRLAIADPKLAPYGRAAEAALKSLNVYHRVKDRLVFGDNIAQTAQFVQSGSADAGILSLSLALSPPMKNKGRHWLIPETAHPPIEQGGAIMKWASDRDLAEKFREYALSDDGRKILETHGFAVPENVTK